MIDPIEHYGTKINESISAAIGVAVGGVILGIKVKNIIRDLMKLGKTDSELKSATIDYVHQARRLKDLADSYCERNPDAPGCKGRKK